MSIAELAGLLRAENLVASLTELLSLARLSNFDPRLQAVRHTHRDRALQAGHAATLNSKPANGAARCMAFLGARRTCSRCEGYPTTWGAAQFKDQHFNYDAEVVKRLDAAGAVLVANCSRSAGARRSCGSADRRNVLGMSRRVLPAHPPDRRRGSPDSCRLRSGRKRSAPSSRRARAMALPGCDRPTRA